jgi:hypothetical protein
MVMGLAIGVGTIYIMFPVVPFMANLQAGLVITAIKLVANYFIRRYFTGKSHKFMLQELEDDDLN